MLHSNDNNAGLAAASQLESASAERAPSDPPPQSTSLDVVVALVTTAQAALGGGLAQLLTELGHDEFLTLIVACVDDIDASADSAAAELPSIGRLPFIRAAAGTRLMKGHAYLVPLSARLRVHADELSPVATERERRAPLDALLSSVGSSYSDLAVGVLLASAGADAAVGVQTLKANGGLVFASSDAVHEMLEKQVVDPAFLDEVVPPEELARTLSKRIGHVLRSRVDPERRPEQIQTRLSKILNVVREKTGHDFRLYKPTTIVRRVQRRMQVRELESVEDYLTCLETNAEEPELLFRDLLIGVTHFFRDPEAFAQLQEELVPALFKEHGNGSTLRVWVAGCSSGEEAYTVAFLLNDYVEDERLDVKIQIFATDIDEHALQVARRGIYPASISADLSPEQLRRHFHARQDGGFQVSKRIRDCMIFSLHNLVKDAPFSKLDLISCRNVLIYFTNELQARLLPVFHYALRSGGALFLGPAEGLGSVTSLFSTVDKKQRIFRRRDIPTHSSVHAQLTAARPADQRRGILPRQEQPGPNRPLGALVERALLQGYTPPCVVINERREIVYFHGKTGRYLQPAEGMPNLNILDMARPELRVPLRTCIHQARTCNDPVTQSDIVVGGPDDASALKLSVTRLPGPETGSGLYMVIFEEESASIRRMIEARSVSAEPAVHQLEQELGHTQAQLQSLVEQFEYSNEELKSTNEELLSMNEELQSSNEELETSREELQSVNEELETVNGELKFKVAELALASNDSRNLFESTRIATLFLDAQLRIRNFTPATVDLFTLIDADRGRPISHISQRFHYNGMLATALEVLRTLVPAEVQVQALTGSWYIMRVLPYRSNDGVVEGVVVTFSDITALKNAEFEVQRLSAALEERLRWLETLVDVVPVGICFYEPGLHAFRTNRSASELLGGERASQAGADTLPYTWWPTERSDGREQQLRDAMSNATATRDLHFELAREGETRHLLVHSAPLIDGSQALAGQVSALLDITEVKRARELAVAREQQQIVVTELGLLALEESDWDAFLRKALDRLRSASSVQGCEVLQITEDKTQLVRLAHSGWHEAREEITSLPVLEGSPPERALRSGEPILFDCPPGLALGANDYLQEQGFAFGAYVAFHVVGGEPSGLLGVYTRAREALSKQDLVFVRSVAQVLTSAIQRRTIEEARLKEREAATLRRTEEQLRRAERLASLGTFAAGIAHELNNPLSNIALSAEYAVNTPDDERRAKTLASIKTNAHRCGRIVESVLRFARNEAEQRASSDLAAIVHHSMELLGLPGAEPPALFTLKLGDPAPQVYCNPTELEQVFVNLFRNAIEAHPARCHITISARLDDGRVLVEVSDDGPGIPETQLPHIFDPFYSTRRSAGGTGLGLSISHRIVTAHGGELRALSDPRSGATFSIELPTSDSVLKLATLEAEERPDGNSSSSG